MIHIVADAAIPFLGEALEGASRVTYIPGQMIRREHLMDADALLVRTRTRCNMDLLEGTPVKFIASATIGSDHIDAAYCAERGIQWTAAPGCNAGAVRQYIASALACLIRMQKTGFDQLCLGVIGAGNIGSRVVQMAEALGIKTLVNDPPREAAEGSAGFVNLETLLARSDIVSLHVPLSREGSFPTLHLADHGFFGKMKPGAWFINTSRGEVADTTAILQAMNQERIGGCVIDVWDREPEIPQELANAAALATPHIAGYSVEGKANGSAMSVQAISRFFGLGLDSWYPKALIPPDEPIIAIPDTDITRESLFTQTILHTYGIHHDSVRLKRNPQQFEKLRENYVYRREPGAFQVALTSATEPHSQMLEAIGFGVIPSSTSGTGTN
jgi:erythronate-4-phosphate dehydrogenase